MDRARQELMERVERGLETFTLRDGAGRLLSGNELLALSEHWAGWLSARGAQAGDRLAVVAQNGGHSVVWLLAALRLGATFCPVSLELPAATREARLEALDAFIHLDARLADSSLLPSETTFRIREERGEPSPELAAIFFSSGTSGHPRAVGLSALNLLSQIRSHAPLLALSRTSRIVNQLSWSHCFGFALELLAAIDAGASIALPPGGGRSPSTVVEMLSLHRPTHLFAVPLMLSRIDALAAPGVLQELEMGVVGGAPLTPQLSARLTERAWPLRQGYGQTECSPGISLTEPRDFRVGSIGRPVGCEVRILEGELCVKGPNVLARAWSSDTPRTREGWFQTGDLVREEADGTLFFEGRLDDCFKLANGRLFNPIPLERQLLEANRGLSHVLVVGSGADHLTALLQLDAALPELHVPSGESSSGSARGPVIDEALAVPEVIWSQMNLPNGKSLRHMPGAAWRDWLASATRVPLRRG